VVHALHQEGAVLPDQEGNREHALAADLDALVVEQLDDAARQAGLVLLLVELVLQPEVLFLALETQIEHIQDRLQRARVGFAHPLQQSLELDVLLDPGDQLEVYAADMALYHDGRVAQVLVFAGRYQFEE